MTNSTTTPVTASIYKVVHNENGTRDYYIRHIIGREQDPTTGVWRNVYYRASNKKDSSVKLSAKWCQYSYHWEINVKSSLSSMWEKVVRTGSKQDYAKDKRQYTVHCGRFDESTKHITGYSNIRIETARAEVVSHYDEQQELFEITTRRWKIYIPSWQMNRLSVRGREITRIPDTDTDNLSIITELSIDYNQSSIDRQKDLGSLQYTMFDAPVVFADEDPESPEYHVEYTYDV